jgi:hypothetical protein
METIAPITKAAGNGKQGGDDCRDAADPEER